MRDLHRWGGRELDRVEFQRMPRPWHRLAAMLPLAGILAAAGCSSSTSPAAPSTVDNSGSNSGSSSGGGSGDSSGSTGGQTSSGSSNPASGSPASGASTGSGSTGTAGNASGDIAASGDGAATGNSGGTSSGSTVSGGSGGDTSDAGSGSETSLPPPPQGDGGASGAFSVWTNRYDNSRTGANTSETVLTSANVGSSKFGRLFQVNVDGHIFAQPLYMPNLMINGALHNVVFLVTENDSVYAFDADKMGSPLWMKSLGSPMIEAVASAYHGYSGTVPVPSGSNVDCWDMYPHTGITSTPVIDQSTGHMFVVSKTATMGNTYTQELHSLDILTGNDVAGSPATIGGSVPGTGVGGDGSKITFNPLRHLNRPGLLLTGGNVYIAFSSHCDDYPYHGWIFAYSAQTLMQTGIMSTTPNGNQGGIWQSGIGLSADASNNVFFVSGNGDIDTNNQGTNLGMSVGKIALGANGLQVKDWWTAYDGVAQTNADTDLTGGPILLPSPNNLLVAGSKYGKLYVLNPTKLGGFTAGSDKIVQANFMPTGKGAHIHGGPIYWNGPDGPTIYVWPETGKLMGFRVANSLVNTTAAVTGPDSATHPGGIITLSANGATKGTGVVWATFTNSTVGAPVSNDPEPGATAGDAWHHQVHGAFYAYDASTLTPLFKSPVNDLVFAKFSPVTVANGKVYVASWMVPEGGMLNVYGLSP